MKIVLRPHLKIRLGERNIPQDYPKKILSKPEEKYIDTLSNHFIAVRKLEYAEKLRPMMLAYDIIGEDIQVVTIHPISEKQIRNKLERKRWIKHEKN